MGIKDIKLVGFAADYTGLTKKLYEEDKKMYYVCLFIIRLQKLKEWMKVKNIGKPTRNGTRISFTNIESKNDFEKECKILKEFAIEHELDIVDN